MSNKILTRQGPVNTTYFRDPDGKLAVHRTQDVSKILESNKRQYNDSPETNVFREEVFNKVASLPMVVYEQWLKEGVDALNPEHMPAVRRKLNDPEYRYLRTLKGKI